MDYQGLHDYGGDLALAYLRDGKPGPLRKLLADAHGKDAQRKAAASVALGAFFFMLANVLDRARTRGVRFTGRIPPTLVEFRYESSCGVAAYSAAAQRLLDAAVALRRSVPGFSASRIVMKADGAGAGDKPAGPVKVEVVSMPRRETASKIKRNAAGEIVSTLQIEQDC